jgi:hypothetical protein
MRFWTVERALMHALGAVCGGFLGFGYSAIPSVILDVTVKLLFERELGLADFLINSPLLIGFFCCVGAFHIGAYTTAFRPEK